MRRWQKLVSAFASLVLASGIVFSVPASSLAQKPTEEQILNALKPAPALKTRGLTSSRHIKAMRTSAFIDRIRTIRTRGLTRTERDELFEHTKRKPNIDLEVYFDFDSSTITPRAESDLMTLGRALTNPDLRESVFLIGGHTDAKGSADYNQKLSERRAAAVKRFLNQEFEIPNGKLATVGCGEEQLKNTSEPFAAENRRVQFINLKQTTAGW